MLDKVITLRSVKATALEADSQAVTHALTETAAQQSGKVAVRVVAGVVANAAKRHCQLKLWDPHGRNPEALEPCEFVDTNEKTWDFKERPDELNGRTLTWSVRLFAPEAGRFELIVEVLQGGKVVTDGFFRYSGPLEASEIEERTGRFHFTVQG